MMYIDELQRRLRELGVELALDRHATKLGIKKGHGRLLDDELKAALKEHYDDLLRHHVFRHAMSGFQRHADCVLQRSDHDAHHDASRQPLYDAIARADSAPGALERLHEAWYEPDLDTFKGALEEYLRPAYEVVALRTAPSSAPGPADHHGLQPGQPSLYDDHGTAAPEG